MKRKILRNGVLMPPKQFCESCDHLMIAATERSVPKKFDNDWMMQLIRNRTPHSTIMALIAECPDGQECFTVRAICPSCQAASPFMGSYTKRDEADTVVAWHNSEDHADDEEKVWAERHRAIPGYDERMIACMLDNYPEREQYLIYLERDGRRYPRFVIPDPVPGRNRPFRICNELRGQTIVYFGGSPHGHNDIWPGNDETWSEAERRTLERVLESARAWFNEELVAYESGPRERPGSGGCFSVSRFQSDDSFVPDGQYSYWSWHGTYDHEQPPTV